MRVDENGLKKIWLEGTGDFESEECIELLKACDIVVTNPPFERLVDFLLLLDEYKKQYIILGNMNNVFTCKAFPLVKEGRLFFGKSIRSGGTKFYVPETYPLGASQCGFDKEGRRFISVPSVRWLENIKYFPADKPLELTCKYSPEAYPDYDTYDAINVDKTKDIPVDYKGIMGVPITYFDKHDPARFEIKGMLSGARKSDKYYLAKPIVNGKYKFKRLAIQRIG